MNGLKILRKRNRFVYLQFKLNKMTKSQKNTYWILFFLSIALSVVVYLFLPSMVSLTVVPLVTTFVKALDLI